ncbi:ATP-dependent nuclease [Sedimentibacter saalensis]|uniref:ATP-dependent nuclease n=1 Tax=Sedimentibacter saalensis TaxID=130788 RepID=UPI00289A6467|nr:AAA family ATPase [Sedimentibacter saalensis]
MKISSIYIQNFRKLRQCRIDFSKNTTLFVGANNSGKTSAMDALGKFLAGRSFVFNDLTISNRTAINAIGEEWVDKECKMPEDLAKWNHLLPMMDVWLEVDCSEIHYVASIIPTLKWRGGKLGIRLAFQPKDISKLFAEYREAYYAARTTEAAGKGKDVFHINLYPKDLCDFLDRKLNTYFFIKSYVLDPKQSETEPPQSTPYGMECFTDNPLKGIIKIDMINAQRGFSDPDSSDDSERARKQLSTQMRSYYDKHLDPEKLPTPKDLEILEVTEQARGVFDKNLAEKFAPAISELEGLGYPGVTDPKITITTKVSTSETLKHDSAVQYALSKNDGTLKLPEKYNGLGYQNLISMVFDLMSFRDSWMRVGKARQEQDDTDTIEPLHLVLVEEPEAHLHMQVQQVFVRKAYSVLRNHEFLKSNENFATQLVISTHSSHIARETDFANLRYFKRLPECTSCNIATAKVINLSDVFGKEDETDKFVTRYLQTTHCDLFFADAAILVEGSAESMLVPHFIKEHYPELHQRYVSILSISGRHSHRLSPLIDKLCLPTLVISDLDSAEPGGHHKAVRPERSKGLISSNYAIANWLIKEKNLDKLLDFGEKQKEFEYKIPYMYSIRIAYQTPVQIDFKGVPTEVLSSTFEDCMVYANYKLFKDLKLEEDDADDAGNLLKKVNAALKAEKSFDDIHKQIYDELRNGKTDQKAEFALDLIYSIDPGKLTVPPYIAEGLEWLQTILRPEEC